MLVVGVHTLFKSLWCDLTWLDLTSIGNPLDTNESGQSPLMWFLSTIAYSWVLLSPVLLQSPCLETRCGTCHAKWPHVFNTNGNILVVYVRKNRYPGAGVLSGCSDIFWDNFTLTKFQDNCMDKNISSKFRFFRLWKRPCWQINLNKFLELRDAIFGG